MDWACTKKKVLSWDSDDKAGCGYTGFKGCRVYVIHGLREFGLTRAPVSVGWDMAKVHAHAHAPWGNVDPDRKTLEVMLCAS